MLKISMHVRGFSDHARFLVEEPRWQQLRPKHRGRSFAQKGAQDDRATFSALVAVKMRSNDKTQQRPGAALRARDFYSPAQALRRWAKRYRAFGACLFSTLPMLAISILPATGQSPR